MKISAVVPVDLASYPRIEERELEPGEPELATASNSEESARRVFGAPVARADSQSSGSPP
jgi:hypothetical protein